MLKPKHPCAQPGCPALTDSRYCAAHYQKRPSARLRYPSKWDRYSKDFRGRHPFCCDPFGRHRGQIVPSECVGHIKAHTSESDPLFWNPANHYPLCNACNAYQCVLEEGGFGNRKTDRTVGHSDIVKSEAQAKGL